MYKMETIIEFEVKFNTFKIQRKIFIFNFPNPRVKIKKILMALYESNIFLNMIM